MSRLLELAKTFEFGAALQGVQNRPSVPEKTVQDCEFSAKALRAFHEILQLKPRTCHIWNHERFKDEAIPVIDARDIHDALKRHGIQIDET